MIYDARRVRRIFYNLRTEASSPGRDAAALGVGVLIGLLLAASSSRR